jgi:hypothetical protein
MARPDKDFAGDELSLMLGLDAGDMNPLHIAAQIMAYRGVLSLEGKTRKVALISRTHVRSALLELQKTQSAKNSESELENGLQRTPTQVDARKTEPQTPVTKAEV